MTIFLKHRQIKYFINNFQDLTLQNRPNKGERYFYILNCCRYGKNCCDNMTAIIIWFDHGDRSETGSSVVSSVISRWDLMFCDGLARSSYSSGSRGRVRRSFTANPLTLNSSLFWNLSGDIDIDMLNNTVKYVNTGGKPSKMWRIIIYIIISIALIVMILAL